MRPLRLLTFFALAVVTMTPLFGVTISTIPDQCLLENSTLGPVPFTVSDPSVFFLVTSSQPTLVPPPNIGGFGTARTFTITPATGQTGTAIISIATVGGSPPPGAATFQVKVVPDQPPIMQCPQSLTAIAAPDSCSTTVTYTPTAQGPCGAIPVTCDPASGAVFDLGTHTVVCSATTPGGSKGTCSFPVTVLPPDQAPKMQCPTAVTATADPVSCSAIVAFVVTAQGTCGPASVTCNPPSGSVFATGTQNVTCTATAPSGTSTSSCSFPVTVLPPDLPPVTSCPAPITATAGLGACSIPVTFVASAQGACGPADVTCNPPSGSLFTVGTQTVTCTATAPAGASTSTCSFPVTVLPPDQPPVISCPAPITVTAGLGACSIPVTFVTSAQGACGPADVTCNPPSGSLFTVGTQTVTCTATAPAGASSSTCSFTVTVLPPDQAPTMQCPKSITATADLNSCGTLVSFTATAQGACGPAVITCSPASGSLFTVGTQTVTCMATAPNGTSMSTCSFPVTVLPPDQPPTILCPDPITAAADSGSCSTKVEFAATAQGACGPAIVVCNPPSGTVFAVGTQSVTCTATVPGTTSSSTCSFTVTVTDSQPPTWKCPADMTATLQPGQVSAMIAYDLPAAQDNCGMAMQSCSPPLGNSFSAGTTVIVCQAVDNSGNVSECSFSVTVNAPAILNKCPIGKGGWKNHPAAWPAQTLTLGTVTYDKTALLKILGASTKSDASIILASQLIAARLSILNGSDPAPVSSTLSQANQLLQSLSGSLPLLIQPSSVLGQAMVSLGAILDQYNSGQLTPHCVP